MLATLRGGLGQARAAVGTVPAWSRPGPGASAAASGLWLLAGRTATHSTSGPRALSSSSLPSSSAPGSHSPVFWWEFTTSSLFFLKAIIGLHIDSITHPWRQSRKC
ncbi:hypothetical protein GH733_016095 [Mirounga leonina]|nr:hypothetical protein GH733_016095 [Mirounga leonina]